ncbi:hypothetical protein PPERSA_01671 [Pseudocohnilembus persalinus]|uniref:AD domain-containing protein n=1 Tax=Pseudocohnilembus persalinus TaxID=266149 RepID=A0A0V0R0R6_PSEPJ|nr:hypothetical protein PPERSA_01671 [Pseudocohnilembus persalinus]|eukprot:KRX08126.1 hypothetical protein PPERSA_01671 [Pseudocohnilembus persalinus]
MQNKISRHNMNNSYKGTKLVTPDKFEIKENLQEYDNIENQSIQSKHGNQVNNDNIRKQLFFDTPNNQEYRQNKNFGQEQKNKHDLIQNQGKKIIFSQNKVYTPQKAQKVPNIIYNEYKPRYLTPQPNKTLIYKSRPSLMNINQNQYQQQNNKKNLSKNYNSLSPNINNNNNNNKNTKFKSFAQFQQYNQNAKNDYKETVQNILYNKSSKNLLKKGGIQAQNQQQGQVQNQFNKNKISQQQELIYDSSTILEQSGQSYFYQDQNSNQNSKLYKNQMKQFQEQFEQSQEYSQNEQELRQQEQEQFDLIYKEFLQRKSEKDTFEKGEEEFEAEKQLLISDDNSQQKNKQFSNDVSQNLNQNIYEICQNTQVSFQNQCQNNKKIENQKQNQKNIQNQNSSNFTQNYGSQQFSQQQSQQDNLNDKTNTTIQQLQMFQEQCGENISQGEISDFSINQEQQNQLNNRKIKEFDKYKQLTDLKALAKNFFSKLQDFIHQQNENPSQVKSIIDTYIQQLINMKIQMYKGSGSQSNQGDNQVNDGKKTKIIGKLEKSKVQKQAQIQQLNFQYQVLFDNLKQQQLQIQQSVSKETNENEQTNQNSSNNLNNNTNNIKKSKSISQVYLERYLDENENLDNQRTDSQIKQQTKKYNNEEISQNDPKKHSIRVVNTKYIEKLNLLESQSLENVIEGIEWGQLDIEKCLQQEGQRQFQGQKQEGKQEQNIKKNNNTGVDKQLDIKDMVYKEIKSYYSELKFGDKQEIIIEDISVQILPPYKPENVEGKNVKARDAIKKMVTKMWNRMEKK